MALREVSKNPVASYVLCEKLDDATGGLRFGNFRLNQMASAAERAEFRDAILAQKKLEAGGRGRGQP